MNGDGPSSGEIALDKLKGVKAERDQLDRDFNSLLDVVRKIHLRVATLEKPEYIGDGFFKGGLPEARKGCDRVLTTLYSGRYQPNEELTAVLKSLKGEEG